MSLRISTARSLVRPRLLRAAALAVACASPLPAQFWSDTPFARVAFFPPVPPVFGAPVGERTGLRPHWIDNRPLTAPDGLADFVAESFYPALSTRLFNLKLDRRIETRLHAYRTARQRETNALLDLLLAAEAGLAPANPAALQALAAEQTPRLAALEQEEERLRADLIPGGWFSDGDWNGRRRWKLDPRKDFSNAVDAEARFQVVRATAHYQTGLLPAQRGLLTELAIDLRDEARRARGLPANRAESDAIFFSPETARFRLPPGVTLELRAKFATYNGRKAALKRALLETVVAQDKADAETRSAAFDALADRQWPEIVALEALAEEMRGELAARLAPAPPPAPPWVPAEIFEAIHRYNADRDDYFHAMRIAVELAADQLPRPAEKRGDEERQFEARRAEVKRAAALEFQRTHAERFGILEAQYRAIRDSLAILAQHQVDRRTGQPLSADTLLRVHAASMAEFETFGRTSVLYTHYRIAMVQPGLSPEQRRLLFGYALMGLAQPLPFGEFMPPSSAQRPFATP
ncbi:MAG: hypothetical protein Q8N18_04325 [Opitutaceae bacterium]|nr:hypothetical protein [Opitutaceae bacterium]